MRVIYFIGGWIALILGIVGIIIPGLPTTPFILLAAWFFARSSKKIHKKLLANKHLGPIISDWEKNKIISRKIKWYATTMMISCVSLSLFLIAGQLYLQLLIVTLVGYALWFIWTKPESELT